MSHRENTGSGIWTAAFAALIVSMGANAQSAKMNYQIAGGDASKALKDFASQSHLQILFDYQVVRALQTQPVHGPFEPEDALGTLLRGTGLTFQQVNARTVAIRRADPPATAVAADFPQPQSGVPQAPLGVAQSERLNITEDPTNPSSHEQTFPKTQRPDPGVMQLEEIIVTAQKREESIRSVPISISAVTAQDLAANHIQTFEDLSRAVPNLSFSSLGGEGLSNLQIRGISSQAGTATVAIYVDDVSLTTRNLYSDGAAEPRILDINRVEVLRGPQGTLYGASALGGTIRFVTQQPIMDKFTGEAFAEGAGISHGGANWDVRSILNLPLVSDRVALRLGAESGVRSGFIDVQPLIPGDAPTPHANRNDWTVGKAALLMKATDSLSFTAAVFYQRYHANDTDVVNLNVPTIFVATKGLLESSTDTLAVPSLTINWDAGFADLTSVTGFYHRAFDRINDVTVANSESLALGSISNPHVAADVFNLKSANYLNTRVNQISEEVRLTSKPLDGDAPVPITWLIGGYFSNERTYLFDAQPIFGLNAAFAKFGADPQNPADLSGAFSNDFVNDLSYFATRLYQTKQYAGFGEATYHVKTSIRLTAGFRYLKAREAFDRVGNFYYSACAPVLNGSGCPALAHLTGDSHALTPKFAFGWDLTQDTTLYANITKGFRLGSENRPVPLYGDPNQDLTAPGANSTRADLRRLGLTSIPATYEPDSLWNYEIGTKSLFFDRHLSIDLSAFYIRWSDIQQTIALTTSGYDFEANAGTAKSYGMELATKAKLGRGWTLEASGGYTKATLDKGVTINGQIVNGTYAGEDVAGVPRWSGAVSALYDFQIADSTYFVRSNANFVDKSHGSLVTTDPDYVRPAYTLLGASAGLTLGRCEFSLFGTNLANNDKIIQRPNIRNAGVSLGYRIEPRVIGANVRVTF